MKSDRELLELAAKAAGIDAFPWPTEDPIGVRDRETGHLWSPLTDDGDALRLAVKLRIRIEPITGRVRAFTGKTLAHAAIQAHEPYGPDTYAATRRAIVRAAAAIGEQQ